MRFKLFLEGGNDYFGYFANNAEEAAQLIYNDCQPFLKEIDFASDPRRNRLYRGMKNIPERLAFNKVNTLNARAPKDSAPAIHGMLDQHFEKKFGHPFRSDAIFVTSGQGIASDYGRVFLVFPRGDFHYLWSPKIIDAYNSFDGWKHGEDPLVLTMNQFSHHFSMKNLWGTENEHKLWPKYKQELADALETDGFGYVKDSGLTDAVKSHGNEVMIKCSSFYAVYCEIPVIVDMDKQRAANEILDALVELVRH